MNQKQKRKEEQKYKAIAYSLLGLIITFIYILLSK